MKLPAHFLDSLENTQGFTKEAFEQVHASGQQVTSIRINPFKHNSRIQYPASRIPHHASPIQHPVSSIQHHPVPWTQYGYYLDTRPSFTFDPLFHAGTYYVQEASSMFLEQALKQTVDLSRPLKLLDLSAAPGGKSTHIQSLISPTSLLVCNEVVRSRANVLKENIIKWGANNIVITHNDPVAFSKLENYFDVIVVDAPCSGSGLFRRDPTTINEWSEQQVQACSERQQKILADVWPALKKDGILVYSTCSYSMEEDEYISDWLMQNFSIAHCPLSVDTNWGIVESATGYRFWPDKLKGEGFFLAVFKKMDGDAAGPDRVNDRLDLVTKKEKDILEQWVRTEGLEFVKYENTVYAWPLELMNDIEFIRYRLHVIYSGTRVGKLIRDKLVPDHALAMSQLVQDSIPRFELNIEQAIAYLQKKDIIIEPTHKGWQLVTFGMQILGWINVLQNRINNYYPREMRILKDN